MPGHKFFSLVTLLAALGLSGCLMSPPQAPHANVAVRGADTPEGLETYKIAPAHGQPLPRRNLLFVALDDVIQTNFQPQLESVYHSKTPVRIEDVAWWVVAPELRGVYSGVVRIPPQSFTRENLLAGISELEAAGDPYDVFLLVHGIPNNLYTTYGHPIVSWKDIDGWKGQFPHLELLFLQSCYGSSLVPDWQGTGAKFVISYPGADLDFFYPIALFHELQKKLAIPAAFAAAKTDVKDEIRHSPFARAIISTLGYPSLEGYLTSLPDPELAVK